MIIRLDLPKEMLSAVLLVAGETHTGNTMKLYFDYFQRLESQQIRRATFFLQEGSTEKIEYWGLQSTTARRMPWMFSKTYRMDSRSQEEKYSLTANTLVSENGHVREGQ